MIYYTWSKGSLFSFCKDQQFGKHYMRIRKMINFKMISSVLT